MWDATYNFHSSNEIQETQSRKNKNFNGNFRFALRSLVAEKNYAKPRRQNRKAASEKQFFFTNIPSLIKYIFLWYSGKTKFLIKRPIQSYLISFKLRISRLPPPPWLEDLFTIRSLVSLMISCGNRINNLETAVAFSNKSGIKSIVIDFQFN